MGLYLHRWNIPREALHHSSTRGVVVVFSTNIPKSYFPWLGGSVSSIKRLSLLYGSHVRFRGPQYSGVGEGSKPGDKRTDSNDARRVKMRERDRNALGPPIADGPAPRQPQHRQQLPSVHYRTTHSCTSMNLIPCDIHTVSK